MNDHAQLIQQADRLAAGGDLAGACALIERALSLQPDLEGWNKLAALRRALGDDSGALDAVHRALAIRPLDFFALLSRASLLERMAVEGFGEAYGRALAQMPEGELPPPLARMVSHARDCYARHQQAQIGRLDDATRECAPRLTADEGHRLDRFKSNIARTTHAWHSNPTHFHYPGLVEREFHDRGHFPWLADLESATDAIEAEMHGLLAGAGRSIVPYIQYAAHEHVAQWAGLNNSPDWSAIHIIRNGVIDEDIARRCPETMRVLAGMPQPGIEGCSPNAMISLLAPRTSIPPHCGVSNTRLVCHLPLVVPAGCWFRVGAETRHWERGKAWVFDDTIEHEACNPTDALRVILIADLWHPGLSEAERQAVRAVMSAESNTASMAL